MKTYKVRIKGTINSEVEVEVANKATDEQIRDAALREWQYVEYEDLWADCSDDPEEVKT